MSAAKARDFRERLLGTTHEALVLSDAAADGARRALTGNYVEVRLPEAAPGRVVPVTIETLDDAGVVHGRLAA